MKNIKIEKTMNNTYVVKADTKRFGEGAIMYESFKLNECIEWLRQYGIEFDYEIVDVMLENMPEEKKQVLKNQIQRNDWLTTHYEMSEVILYVTKNGFLLKMEAVRSSFVLFMDYKMNFRRTPNNEIETATHKVELYDLENDKALNKYIY